MTYEEKEKKFWESLGIKESCEGIVALKTRVQQIFLSGHPFFEPLKFYPYTKAPEKNEFGRLGKTRFIKVTK